MKDGDETIRARLKNLGSNIKRDDEDLEISELEERINKEIEKLMDKRLQIYYEQKEVLDRRQFAEEELAQLAIKKQLIDQRLTRLTLEKFVFVKKRR